VGVSELRFIPIPTTEEALRRVSHLWLPFIPRIADRSDETVDELIDAIISGRVQIGLVWDDDNRKAHALVGWLYRRAGRELIAEVHWITGWGSKEWRHLLAELEKYLKEHAGATVIKPLCRPGWRPFLKQQGYRQTHVVMEKML